MLTRFLPLCFLLGLPFLAVLSVLSASERPHVVLVMADDMGWGQTGYRNHPVLKTPNLDAMAASGLRFDRFYAGAPVCSPTRASLLTGRTNDRTGVWSHGYGLRLQEKTVPRAFAAAGYATGHFGKWHLNGLRGPGVPILAGDEYGPRGFGFQEWISVTNFFDLDPILSRQGVFEEFQGDSSEISVELALEFITRRSKAGEKTFSVVWFGTPHSPFRALEKDAAQFPDDGSVSVDHYGELVAMDRSIGTLRAGLRELGIAEDTLFWFNSDNGGLPKMKPETVGGLRGFKGSFYEGGLRVPGIIEWPAGIPVPRVTEYPACTMDIFPTLVDVLGLPESVLLQPIDGVSLKPLFRGEIGLRQKPIPFRQKTKGALVDNQYKLVVTEKKTELFDLVADPAETTDTTEELPEVAARMQAIYAETSASIERSIAGADYPEGKVDPLPPGDTFWTEVPAYEPYFEEWKLRPEYQSRLSKGKAAKKNKAAK